MKKACLRPGEEEDLTMTQAGARVWGGRVMSWLAVAPFVLSSVMKFMAPPQLAEGFGHLGLPMSMRVPLAILEIACVVIDLVHATAVLGAILLTGFIGGAICTHWRVGDLFIVHIVIGLFVWGGLWLRESRLRDLIPLRRPVAP
jgi:hypothetical protein